MLIPVGIVCLFVGIYIGYWSGYCEAIEDCFTDLEESEHSTNKVERNDEII